MSLHNAGLLADNTAACPLGRVTDTLRLDGGPGTGPVGTRLRPGKAHQRGALFGLQGGLVREGRLHLILVPAQGEPERSGVARRPRRQEVPPWVPPAGSGAPEPAPGRQP